MITKMKQILGAAAAMLMLAACGSPKTNLPLEGTQWKLTEMDGKADPAFAAGEDTFNFTLDPSRMMGYGVGARNRPLGLHGPQPVLGHISSPQGTAGRKGAGHTCRMPLLPAAVRNGTAAGKPAPRPILTAGTVQLLFPGTCVAHSPADALHRQCLPLFF